MWNDGMGWMVIIGHGSSKSTFGANDKNPPPPPLPPISGNNLFLAENVFFYIPLPPLQTGVTRLTGVTGLSGKGEGKEKPSVWRGGGGEGEDVTMAGQTTTRKDRATQWKVEG